ncbi:MAG TPA: hypothetical protein VGY54_14910, partial [Polyangiaceae bacterium]|nr:hypothetical protein [Polyangiaceae bacterium]
MVHEKMAVLLVTLLALTACSSGSTPTPANAGSGTGAAMQGSGSAASGATPSGSGGPNGSGSASGATSPPTPMACDAYCTAITNNCTGVNAQYHDKATCMNVCQYLPAGMPGDTSGNSIACRAASAMAAAGVTATPNSACWAAGPLGYGTCGEECDTFCSLTMAYCSRTAGYVGNPVWASYDECYATCQRFGRNVDFGMDGGYSATTVVAGDTLECRAYHLVDNAFQSTSLQQMHCPHAGAASAPCGPGPGVVGPMDGGAPSPQSDAAPPPVMVYDGGANVINASNWNETIYPFSKRRMILRDEGNPHLHLEDLGDPTKNWSTATDGAWARSAQFIGNNQILGGRNDGYEVYDLTTGAIVKRVQGYGNTMSAYRMANGETMLTRNGCTLDFLGP